MAEGLRPRWGSRKGRGGGGSARGSSPCQPMERRLCHVDSALRAREPADGNFRPGDYGTRGESAWPALAGLSLGFLSEAFEVIEHQSCFILFIQFGKEIESFEKSMLPLEVTYGLHCFICFSCSFLFILGNCSCLGYYIFKSFGVFTEKFWSFFYRSCHSQIIIFLQRYNKLSRKQVDVDKNFK